MIIRDLGDSSISCNAISISPFSSFHCTNSVLNPVLRSVMHPALQYSGGDGGKFIVQDYVRVNSSVNCANKIPVSDIFTYDPEMCPYHLISHLLQIILERSPKERNLEELKRKKFLVPEDMPLIHFQGIIRRRLNISPEKALFFLINADTVVSLTRQMDEIFRDYKAQDGCLHIFYASQDCFG